MPMPMPMPKKEEKNNEKNNRGGKEDNGNRIHKRTSTFIQSFTRSLPPSLSVCLSYRSIGELRERQRLDQRSIDVQAHRGNRENAADKKPNKPNSNSDSDSDSNYLKP